MAEPIIFKPYGFQIDVLRSNYPITLAATGIQAGKTTIGALWLFEQMIKHSHPEDNFIVCSPTYKILQQSTLPPILRFLDGYGQYQRQDNVLQMQSGARCYFRTGTDPDSIVGITNVRAIYGDEAGLYSLYFWENIQARAAFKSAPVLLTTSPYTLNWVYKDLIRPKQRQKDARPDVLYLKAKSTDNPYFPREYYERMRETMDDRRFRAMFGGEWEKMEGLVYDCFEDETNTCTPFSLPQGTKYYAGVDWGTTAPFAMVIRAITPDGLHFQVAEVYRTGLTLLDMIQVAKQKAQSYPIELFYCDPSQPGHIKEFCIAGLAAVGANNEIRLGIDLHYDLIKSRRYKLFRGDNKFSIDEYETYHYPALEETKQDTKIIDNLPVKQNDHAMDANRYVTVSTYTGDYRKEPEIYSPMDEKKKLSIYERADRIYEPVETFDEW
jgi:PBSX family phage terminase large subunit